MTAPLSQVARAYQAAKRDYDAGHDDLYAIGRLVQNALNLLQASGTSIAQQGMKMFGTQVKAYEIRKFGNLISRPIRRDLFITDATIFAEVWEEVIAAVNPDDMTLPHPKLDSALYTAVTAFAVAYDLHKSTSRKTPGTFFEILMGSLLAVVTNRVRGKQITLPGTRYKVTTDIVLLAPAQKPTLVIPTKITTRERIVQPWVHQRILDNAFGFGTYKSVLVAVSELQRDKDKGVNEICVPGQVGLYQQYVAQLCGMYYLDPPAAYSSVDFSKIILAKPVSVLLNDDLPDLLEL